jgi:hypothetical protein
LALINALALAKVMLVAQDQHLADRFHDAPLIYSNLVKSFVFTVVLACFKIAEDFVLRRIHGRSFQESISYLGGGTGKGILTLAAVVLVMLIPFLGVTELRRVFGADLLFGVFFRPRYQLNLNQPPARA